MTDITLQQVEVFILVFLRVTAIIGSIPVLANKSVPVRVKGGLSIVTAMLITPFVPEYDIPAALLPLVLKMAGEVCIGIIIGLTVRFIFSGIQLAGQLIGFQMGFAIVNVVDPLSSSQVSIISQFIYILAILIFFAVNGHHLFLYAIAESYKILPGFTFQLSGQLIESIVMTAKDIFILALKIGIPIITLLLLTSVGLGLIARTVPQMNIFIVGFPLKIGVGLIGLGLTLQFMAKALGVVFGSIGTQLKILMQLM